MAEVVGLVVAGLVLGALVPLASDADARAHTAGLLVGAVAMPAVGLALPGAFWAYLLATAVTAAVVGAAVRAARPRR